MNIHPNYSNDIKGWVYDMKKSELFNPKERRDRVVHNIRFRDSPLVDIVGGITYLSAAFTFLGILYVNVPMTSAGATAALASGLYSHLVHTNNKRLEQINSIANQKNETQ